MRVLYVDDDRINGLLFAESCRMTKPVELQTVLAELDRRRAGRP